MTADKLCQNCNHGELHHELLEGAYYKCSICGAMCSGKFYQREPGE
ncbi:MAG: hypothetical protein ABI361_04270 [Nitrososphaera sp.]